MWVSAIFAVWLSPGRCSTMGAMRKPWSHPVSFRVHRCCSLKLRTGTRYKEAHQLHLHLSPNTSTCSSSLEGCPQTARTSFLYPQRQVSTGQSWHLPPLSPYQRDEDMYILKSHCLLIGTILWWASHVSRAVLQDWVMLPPLPMRFSWISYSCFSSFHSTSTSPPCSWILPGTLPNKPPPHKSRLR